MSQIKNESLPEVNFKNAKGEGVRLLGTPNLGTLWTVEFITVSFKLIGVANAGGKKEGIWRFVVQLLENEIVVAEETSKEYKTGPEGEEFTYKSGIIGFNFPQVPAIPAGQSIGIKVTPEAVKTEALAQMRLLEGTVTMGYTIHAKR